MPFTGVSHKVGEHIDTDAIIPARFLVTTDPKKLGENCMEGLEHGWVKRVQVGDILVAERNFGCGSSREHAPIAIKAAGISCVIAKTFARIFYRNAINIGRVYNSTATIFFYDRLLLERATERYTVTTKSGDRSTVCLPDGTQVRLNGSSTLTYPANFNATNRSVELSGAAYFDVSPDEKHRFEVKVGNCSVVVKGTKFDVTAYPDDSLITTTLLEGAVGFTAPRGETLLRPGESLTYDRFAETTAITHVNTAQYLAWIEGRIEFIDVTIVQLCESLSSLYGVEITLDDRLRADGTFITIRLSNQESLDSVLKALDLIVPVSVHRQGPSVRLSAK